MGVGLREILLEDSSSSFPTPQRAKFKNLALTPCQGCLRAAGNPHLLSDQVGQSWLGALDLERAGPRNRVRSSDLAAPPDPTLEEEQLSRIGEPRR